MAEIENLGMLEEIQSIVSDKLQVVSYKWLSRNFLVSSNAAKSLLEDFVEKYGNGLQVIYSLSGWLKNNPSTYHIRLVSKNKLSDAKQEFNGDCSIQVYSVQACLPKDPATLWNHEFVQAEDLFKQPLSVDNCLRNNRFCGVSNSFVKRNAGGTPLGAAALQGKAAGVSDSSKGSSARLAMASPQPQQNKVHQSSTNSGAQSLEIAKNVKAEGKIKTDREHDAQLAPPKEKVPQPLPDKRKGQSDKNSSNSGGSLASMWGRASSKPNPDASSGEANNSKQNSAASAEAQISAREAVMHGSSDEDRQDFNIKRCEGNKKRRVVFDYSDEEGDCQDAVSLGSPDPPKKSTIGSKISLNASGLETNLSFKEEKENRPNNKEVKEEDVKSNKGFAEEVLEISKGKKAESPISKNTVSHVPETEKAADAGPKRRKVLKTRIDERGREVTEVVWEGEEPDTKSDNSLVKSAETNTVNNTINRPNVVRKSPAVGNSAPTNQSGKAANKKGGSKDPKQGNILSFFKKV